MCGLFGWSLKRDAKPCGRKLALLARSLSVLNDKRGGHSWGWYAPLSAALARDVGPMASAVPGKILASHPVLIGHTRFATTGEKTAANAHPFPLHSLTGAHNGIVYNHADLNTRLQRSCAVDSQHIFLSLEEGRPLAEIRAYGAIAFAWHDEPETVCLGRFNGGELAVARVKGLGIVWSSDSDHLETALAIAGYERWTHYRIEEGALYCATAGKLFSTDERLDFAASERGQWKRWDDDIDLADDCNALVRCARCDGSFCLDDLEEDAFGRMACTDCLEFDAALARDDF